MTPPTNTTPATNAYNALLLARNLHRQLAAIVADDRDVTADEIGELELIAEAIVTRPEKTQ